MLYELVDCLRYLEEKGCYQGDIKPSNILLDENYTPKLVESYNNGLLESLAAYQSPERTLLADARG
jgi:serine/threonine protein kinase